MKDRLAEIKHWYALHLLPQRRLMEDIHWMVNRIEELECEVDSLRVDIWPDEPKRRKRRNNPGASA